MKPEGASKPVPEDLGDDGLGAGAGAELGELGSLGELGDRELSEVDGSEREVVMD